MPEKFSGTTSAVVSPASDVAGGHREEVIAKRPPVLVMQTGLNPVSPGGDVPGWVSGNPAGLAASASLYPVFDLGPSWDQYSVVQIVVYPEAPSSGFSGVMVCGSDNTVFSYSRRLGAANATNFAGIFSSLTTAAGPQGLVVRPCGRYVVMQMTNADSANALGPNTKITLSAFP